LKAALCAAFICADLNIISILGLTLWGYFGARAEN
jgi:hypothetical protein